MVHNIRWGDTLSALARRYGTTVSALARANGISNPDRIYAGRTLQVPGRSDGFDAARPNYAARLGGSEAPTAGAAPATAGSAPAGETRGASSSGGNWSGGVSINELRRIMPGLSAERANAYLPHLNAAMREAGINTPRRQAAFLAQLAHESGQLRYMEEIASGAAYEGRRDLGNTQRGDGVRYKGRGPIQLTGRANYRAAGNALGINLEANPQRASDPDVAFRIAAWYWGSRNLNQYADAGNFSAITYRINGGYNGAADRNAYYNRALGVLA